MQIPFKGKVFRGYVWRVSLGIMGYVGFCLVLFWVCWGMLGYVKVYWGMLGIVEVCCGKVLCMVNQHSGCLS